MSDHTYRFCPVCSGALESRLLKAGEPERLVCSQCGFVFYLDPKIAVGTIIYMLNPEYMSLLWTHKIGKLMLVSAIVLQLIGYLWIRKIINIEI